MFNKQKLLGLSPPAKGFVTFQDMKEPGLSLYVTANEAKSFFVRKRIDGRDERVTIGPFPATTVEQARKKAQQLKGIVASGQNPATIHRVQKRNNQTLGELFEEYMTRYSKKHKKSWVYDEREIKRFLSHWFTRRLSSISRSEIQLLHEKTHDKNGLYQANRLLERLRGMYNKAIEWGWEGQNPASGIKKYKEKSRDRFIQPAEMPCLLRSLNEETNTTIRDYFWILLLTGARKTNTLMMRWEHINWQTHEWRIPDTKNGEPAFIPLVERAYDILKTRYMNSESQWVFPQDDDKDKHFVDPKKGWKRCLERASVYLWLQHDKIGEWLSQLQARHPSLPAQMLFAVANDLAKKERIQLPPDLLDIRIHDIRRTFGSYQAITGASLQVIGKSLGHKSTHATQIYARLNLDAVRSSVVKATESMFKL